MRFGFVGPTYQARSTAVANEEAINLFLERDESQNAQSSASLYYTPGLAIFVTLPESPLRGSYARDGRCFAVGGSKFVEVFADGTQTTRATIANDGGPVSIAATNTQLLIISAGHAYCFTLAGNTIVDVTGSLAGVPILADATDTYFIVCFQNSNKFQMSALLDGTTWPGIQVNAVSVFPDNVLSIAVLHRELWVFGSQHSQPYYNSGSSEVFDVIQGTLLEQGIAATFGRSKIDNTLFWVGQDERGARMAWRANGYVPQRISNHAIESELSRLSTVSDLVSYSYQDGGHPFWVLYFPSSQFSWVYDVASQLWHKRAGWANGAFEPHHSWNHVYAFGKHLVGDWNSGNLYWMDMSLYDDAGATIRRVRRCPTLNDEMVLRRDKQLIADFETGVGPQPPLLDAEGNPRGPQAILRWSDNSGKTWSGEHARDCGQAGQFKTRAIWRRLGQYRHRVYELILTDPVPWVIVDAYLNDPVERLASKLRAQS